MYLIWSQNIMCSLDEMEQKFCADSFRCVYLRFQNSFLHLLCVCHSVGWVTLLLKPILVFTSYLSEKRVKTCWGCEYIIYKCYWMSCIYGSLFVCLLFDLNWTEAYPWLWKRYFVLGVLGHFWYVCTLVPINFEFSLCVCQSGSWHTFLLKFDKVRDISRSRKYIFLKC